MQKSSSKQLVTTVHKKSVAVFRISLKPSQLGSIFQETTAQLSLKAKDIYALIEKNVGINIPKEILPNLTGHAYASLYGMHPNIIPRVNRAPYLLPGQLKLAIVAELKDPKKAIIVAEKLANTLKFGRRGVKRTKQKDGRTQYAIPIPAWPGIIAHWTIIDKYFVYAIGPKALKLTIDAIKNPKLRLFTPQTMNIISSKDSGSIYFNLPNLREMIGSLNLSFTVRLLLANVLQMAGKMDALSLNFGPRSQGIQMQATIRIK